MRRVSLYLTILAAGLFAAALAQVPQGTHTRRSAMPSYRHTAEGNKLDFVITGSSVSNLTPRTLLINEFELTSFKNGDPKQTNIIAQAPECEVDVSNSVAANPGPIKIFTPTTNLFVEGVGFLFTQSNHFLIISNQVKTRVVKSMLKSSMLGGGTNQGGTSQRGKPDVILIDAERGRFDFDSNVVDYAGSVHMVDPQLDLTSDFLTIRFGTNGAIQSVLARDNVVLTTTNSGRATGARGLYWITNGNEMLKLTTDATWHNGDQSAKAQEFTYDSTRHLLTGVSQVNVRWPNQSGGPLGRSKNTTITTVGTNGFREMFADFATMQFPPTNGPVQSMHARGNVIIINDADKSKATAESADYERGSDQVKLSGNPVWWNTNVEVKADVLLAELNTKIYHARGRGQFKTRTSDKHSTAGGKHSTNQWLRISSDEIDYQTNQALFRGAVKARLEDNDRMQDKLDCVLLDLKLHDNEVENATALGDVRGETAPNPGGIVKTISCQRLVADRSIATGLLKTIHAFTNVVIEENGTGTNAPHNQLKADTVIAWFSATTNQIEKAEADRNVEFSQTKAGRTTRATAEHGVYTAGTNDQVILTGTPLAFTDGYDVTGADYMVWRPKSNLFQAFGQYTIIPKKKKPAEPKT